MVAEDCCPKKRGGGENQDIFKRHLEALIDPRRARVCGEDDEGDEDEAEEEGEEVFDGEDFFEDRHGKSNPQIAQITQIVYLKSAQSASSAD